jgi:dTMP kinase
MQNQQPNRNPNRLNKGFFISFEGGEGAGKTSLIRRLAEMLEAEGYQVVITREPGGSPLGDRIRSLLLDKDAGMPISPTAELLLLLTGRAQHIDQLIQPSLQAGKVVLCDRFNDSSIAYQGSGRALGVSRVKELCQLVSGGLVPDLTLYLDVDPDVGLARSKRLTKENAKAGEGDRIEDEAVIFHQRVRDGYRQIGQEEPDRFKVLDAHQSQEDVFNQASQLVKQALASTVRQ